MRVAAKLYRDTVEFAGCDIRKPSQLLARSEYQAFVKEMRAARVSASLGLLNDDWTSIVFEMGRNLKKFSDIMVLMINKEERYSDAESSRLVKARLSEGLARKRATVGVPDASHRFLLYPRGYHPATET